MATLASLVVNISANTAKLVAGMDKATSQVRSSVGKIAKVAAAAGAAAGTALVATAVKGINAFMAFEKQMNEVFTLLPGISEQAMADMTGQVKRFAKEFGVLPEQVVPALYQAISAGVPADNVFAFLETAQKMAIGGVTQLETAVDGLSSVVNAYGSDVISAAKASDVMFTAVKLGKTTADELAGSLFYVTPTAAALGVTFEQVAASISSMTAQGTPTRVAATQMRQFLVEVSKAGTETSKTFQKLSGKSFKEFIAGGGSVQEALQILEKEAGRMGVGINDLFGSVEAGNAALQLTGKGTEKFRSDLAEMNKAAGATQAAYERMDKGLGRSFDRIKASLRVALINLGERMAPAVERLADKIQENMPQIERVFDNIADAAGRAIDWVVTHMPDIERAFQSVLRVGKDLVEGIKGLVNWFNHLSGPMQKVVLYGTLGAGALGKTGLLGAVVPLLGALKGPAGLVALISALAVGLDQVSKHMKAGFVEDLGKVSPAAARKIEAASGPAPFRMGQGIGLRWGQQLMEKLLGKNLADMGNAGSQAPKIGGIPGMAAGGRTLTPGWAMVGERGPELLSMPRGATVEPLERAGRRDVLEVHVIGDGLSKPAQDRLVTMIATLSAGRARAQAFRSGAALPAMGR